MLLRLRAFFLLVVVCLSAPRPAAQTGSGGVNRPEHRDKPYLVLVSLDGFKAEYLDRWDLPNIKRAMARGARAQWMQPVFPSLTFPNHYSLVSGVHPDKHGIVANRFYDPSMAATYIYTDNNIVTQGRWYQREPIWVTAESQGMVAACYFWPGSEADIKGIRPTIFNTYSASVPNETRVKTVVEWLQMPVERRPHVITLYFSELDSASHSAPLSAKQVTDAGHSLDRAIGQLMDGIDALPIKDQVYVLLTSDHGMIDTSDKQVVQLTSLLDTAQIGELVAGFSGPVANLHVRGGEARARTLRDVIAAKLQHGKAYLRSELPARYRYSANPRAGDIVIVMDEAWSILVPRIPAAQQAALPAAPGSDRERPGVWGAHGWDNELPSMRALFLAWGPKIKPAATVEPIRNVDVYPFMVEILGLKSATDVDGRAGLIRGMISN